MTDDWCDSVGKLLGWVRKTFYGSGLRDCAPGFQQQIQVLCHLIFRMIVSLMALPERPERLAHRIRSTFHDTNIELRLSFPKGPGASVRNTRPKETMHPF